jgi:hypothetical protein
MLRSSTGKTAARADAALASNQNIENNPMQSSMVVAGMDALSYPCENILTRRANQRHYSIIAQFAKRPWPCPTTGSSSAIAGKKSLPTIEVAPARHSEGSPARCRAARACHARARGDIDVNPVPDLNTATALARRIR